MKTPPHLHSVGEYWIWHDVDYTAYGRTWYAWFASPKASGPQKRGAVRVSGLKGRPGTTAKRVGTRQWVVYVPVQDAWSTRLYDYRVVARTRREAIVLGEIARQYAPSSLPSPRLTMAEGKIYSMVKIFGATHRDPDHWEIVERVGRRTRLKEAR